VFYLEACESGSMFENLNVPGVYAVSAANSSESSWGTFCGDSAKVNGTDLETCLGDLFTVNWLSDLVMGDASQESLQSQYSTVKTLTNKSHVLQWGDTSFTSEPLSAFFGPAAGQLQLGHHHKHKHHKPKSSTKVRDADLDRLYRVYQSTTSSKKRMQASKLMQEQLKLQFVAEGVYYNLAEIAYPGDEKAQHHARTHKHKPVHPECEMTGHKAIRESCSDKFDANQGFALQFHQVVVNICHDINQLGLNLDINAAAMRACGKDPTLVV